MINNDAMNLALLSSPVSKANCAYLQEVQETTEFNIEEISPGLYDAIPALPEIRVSGPDVRWRKEDGKSWKKGKKEGAKRRGESKNWNGRIKSGRMEM